MYKWASVTLHLDNTVRIRYTFYTESQTMPTITVKVGDAAPTTISASDIVADSKGAGYYHFDYAVDATSFDEVHVAAFDGVADYTLTYPVTHYIARKYDESQVLTSALLRALYNYGVSTKAYVTD